ncbi:hypothetical protein CPU12_13705, partial [Malaciobacter molluscorum LMG 25693]
MKIKTIIKILIIAIISLNLTACDDNKSSNNTKEKEIKFTPSLPIPSSKNLREMGLIGLWYDAKKDPVPAMKIGYEYSEKLHDYEKALEWYKYADSMIPLGEN